MSLNVFQEHERLLPCLLQVTVEGFEALLKFAYTSKLHFIKENVLQIRNAATMLGFRDLDEACFDFLLPKFFSKSKSTTKKMCCKKNDKKQISKEEFSTDSDNASFCDKEVKPVADSSSQQEVSLDCSKSEKNMMESLKTKNTPTLGVDAGIDNSTQCPKYRKFQLACGKETYAPEKRICKDCTRPCSPSLSSENSNKEHVVQFPGNSASNSNRESKGQTGEPLRTQTHDKRENHGDKVEAGSEKLRSKKKDELCVMDTEEVMEHSSSPDTCRFNSPKTDKILGERSLEFLQSSHCSLGTFNDLTITCSQEYQKFGADIKKPSRAAGGPEPGSVHQNTQFEQKGENGRDGEKERERFTLGEISTMEMEAAGPLDMQQGSDSAPIDPNFPPGRLSAETSDRWAQSSSSEGPKARSDPSCLFYDDLEKAEYSCSQAGMSECEGTSLSCGSPVNSGEDGYSETETEGDSESSTRERARQVSTKTRKQFRFI